jgi:hypothetical protein
MDYDALREERRSRRKKPFEMTLNTWVPEKWRFVDLETGDVWKFVVKGRNSKFSAADDLEVKRLETDGT